MACSQKALTGFRRLGLRDLAASHLINVACCAARLGRHREAAQLAGAYDVMHSPYLRQAGTPGRSNRFEKLSLLQEKLREDSRAYVRQALGDDAFQVEYSVGSRLYIRRRRRAGATGNELDRATSADWAGIWWEIAIKLRRQRCLSGDTRTLGLAEASCAFVRLSVL